MKYINTFCFGRAVRKFSEYNLVTPTLLHTSVMSSLLKQSVLICKHTLGMIWIQRATPFSRDLFLWLKSILFQSKITRHDIGIYSIMLGQKTAHHLYQEYRKELGYKVYH